MAIPAPVRLFVGSYSRKIPENQHDFPGDQPDQACMAKAHAKAFFNLKGELEDNIGISVGDPRVSISHDVNSIDTPASEVEKQSRIAKVRTWIVTLQAHVHDAK